MLLAGDIGGTKTVLALFSTDTTSYKPLIERTFASGSHDSLEEIIIQFMNDTGADIDAAAFGVAGPVFENRAKVTNLPWQILSTEIESLHGIKQVILCNDFEAVGYGIADLQEEDLLVLQPGRPARGG